ncbi:MAG: type II secretion system protein [Phycisphaerales bacterium]|jgi:type II secretory pathway pseudopilin PulG|nr:type II secretion system protein [Phycisphaerales bacterium]MBT7170351.1 type II secretion system protein [Phycisphaerales bacterium]
MNIRETTHFQRRRTRGFTLAELALALVIAVLAGWLLVGLGDSVRRSQGMRRTRRTIATVMRAVGAYGRETGQWPLGEGDAPSTAALLRGLKGATPSAKLLRRLGDDALTKHADGSEVLLDGFGRRLLYRYQDDVGDRPTLHSVGMDPADGSDDLIVPLPWDE